MRKPLVVVGVAVSALLLAGGVAATTAGAGKTPDHSQMVPAARRSAVPKVAEKQQQKEPRATQTRSRAEAATRLWKPAADDARYPAGPAAAARRQVTPADVSTHVGSPLQRRILALVNKNRRRSGCGNLSLDRRLTDAANEHAADMARRRYFAHESPGGASAGDRVRDAGYRWKRYGENIARGADSPYEVVNGWMRSPAHRHNILDCRLRQMGIGLAISRDRTPYWVQDFATPRR